MSGLGHIAISIERDLWQPLLSVVRRNAAPEQTRNGYLCNGWRLAGYRPYAVRQYTEALASNGGNPQDSAPHFLSAPIRHSARCHRHTDTRPI